MLLRSAQKCAAGALELGLFVVLTVGCSDDTTATAGTDAGTGGAASGSGGSGGAGSGGRAQGAGGSSSSTGGVSPTTGGAGGGGGLTSTGGTPASGGSSDSGAGGVTYTTQFDLTESPLSENGAWHHDGLDWTKVDSGNGISFGTQALGVNRSGPTGYDDSYAYLSGFPPDQQASAIVHLGTIDGSCTHEVEIILRWADAAHTARGYECNVAFDGSYAQIVRWNGPVGDYTYLAKGSVPGGIHDGDTVSASVVGDTITLIVNGTVRATATDSTFTTGNPGIAFWRGMSGCGTFGDYGFTEFRASSL